MSKMKATLADELRAFRKKHATIDRNGRVSDMTWEALGKVSPVAMLTLYRIGTNDARQPTPATCTVTREFMAQHKCKAAAHCINCDKRRSRRLAS